MSYAEAFARQQAVHQDVLADRDAQHTRIGVLLLVEHPPVITISRRASASNNLLATPELLARHGVEIAETDRGGDITYHGPGQLVAYPILDLNRVGLGLHEYMRLLEECVVRTIAAFGLDGRRDASATGVWVKSTHPQSHNQLAKIAAMGVRVRKWISMHGLALNIDPVMEHFGLIVPCGLAGRPVTSMKQQLGEQCPTLEQVKGELSTQMSQLIAQRRAASKPEAASNSPATQ